jgi:hypothetical protein
LGHALPFHELPVPPDKGMQSIWKMGRIQRLRMTTDWQNIVG